MFIEICLLNHLPLAAAAAPSDEAQYAEAITSYCSITGSDEDSARHLLEVVM